MRIARLIVVTGRVQGVFFRAWTEENALMLGLDGWVRNRRRDGSVEALIVGEESAVEEMIARCHEGPPAAAVAEVEVTNAEDPGPAGFTVTRTV
jgi:acylphosphatase